jgi:hypothetical protein
MAQVMEPGGDIGLLISKEQPADSLRTTQDDQWCSQPAILKFERLHESRRRWWCNADNSHEEYAVQGL